MNRERLKDTIRFAEGFRPIPYEDNGQKSAGYGHRLPESWPVKARGAVEDALVSIEQAEDWLDEDVNIAVSDTLRLVPRYDEISESRQEALVEMAYNLGYSRLSKFLRMLAAIDADNWPEAAIQAKSSLWYGQVGNRGRRIIAALRGDTGMRPREREWKR